MRQLFDQNLSPRLLAILAALYGGSTHVRNEGLEAADDDTVWEYAARVKAVNWPERRSRR